MAGLLFWEKKTVNMAGLLFWKNNYCKHGRSTVLEEENCKQGRSIVLEKENCFELRFEGVQRGIHSESKGELGHSIQTDRSRKGVRTNSGQSGTTNLEAESIRSRAESTGGCVKLKTVTEIRRSSAARCSYSRECLVMLWILCGTGSQ